MPGTQYFSELRSSLFAPAFGRQPSAFNNSQLAMRHAQFKEARILQSAIRNPKSAISGACIFPLNRIKQAQGSRDKVQGERHKVQGKKPTHWRLE
jgi:hypothetical protein